MGLNAPGSVVAGASFSASYSYRHDKSGGVVAIVPGGPLTIYSASHPDGIGWFLDQLHAISSAPMNGSSGTVSLVAPSAPGQYGVVTVYNPDGGTIDTTSLMVTAAPAAPTATPPTQIYAQPPPATPPAPAPAPAPVLNPWALTGGAVYTPPSPEPAASDGARLSMQAADAQNYYVANYGPGMLAATQFVLDHEHQLAAIGASHAPATPAATSAAPMTLPAGPGVGGPDVGISSLGGGGGFDPSWSSSNPTTSTSVPNQRQTGAAPPSVGGLVADLTGNKTLLAIAVGVGVWFVASGGHRR